jgi:hypothetical protein
MTHLSCPSSFHRCCVGIIPTWMDASENMPPHESGRLFSTSYQPLLRNPLCHKCYMLLLLPLVCSIDISPLPLMFLFWVVDLMCCRCLRRICSRSRWLCECCSCCFPLVRRCCFSSSPLTGSDPLLQDSDVLRSWSCCRHDWAACQVVWVATKSSRHKPSRHQD